MVGEGAQGGIAGRTVERADPEGGIGGEETGWKRKGRADQLFAGGGGRHGEAEGRGRMQDPRSEGEEDQAEDPGEPGKQGGMKGWKFEDSSVKAVGRVSRRGGWGRRRVGAPGLQGGTSGADTPGQGTRP